MTQIDMRFLHHVNLIAQTYDLSTLTTDIHNKKKKGPTKSLRHIKIVHFICLDFVFF